jgi:hypothetical protein
MSKSKVPERDEAQVLAEAETQRAALVDAEHEVSDLQIRRREMLAASSVEAIQEIDAAIRRAVTKVDIAKAKTGALEGELESLRRAKRDAQIAADLARAHQLAEEARQLIIGNYAAAARAIAETLARLETIEREVAALNARLPSGGAIQVEASLGNCAWLRAKVVLPGIGADANFWPTRPRRQLPNEIYARTI